MTIYGTSAKTNVCPDRVWKLSNSEGWNSHPHGDFPEKSSQGVSSRDDLRGGEQAKHIVLNSTPMVVTCKQHVRGNVKVFSKL